MRPDDRAASASAGAPSVRAAARANAAAPFAAPFHHGAPLGSPSVILRSSEAGGRSEVDARIAMERGVARILLATTTRRGSKLTPLDRIAIETLGMKTGEARRVDLAAAWTGARGRMLTDEDARDIIAGRACSCVRVRRHAVVGALHSGRAYRPACQQISERFQAAGNNRHLHRPTHDGVTGETPGEGAEEGKRSRTSPGGSRLHALLHLQRQPRGSHRLAVRARPKRSARCNPGRPWLRLS